MELKWNETCAILKPTIQVKITKEDVLDIICSAVNGRAGYWVKVDASKEDYAEAKKHLIKQGKDPKDICYEEVFAQVLFDGKEMSFTDVEKNETYFLSLDKLFVGIRKTIEEGYYSHYNWYVPEGDGFGEWQLNCCQVDSDVADAIIQFSLFGEVLFG